MKQLMYGKRGHSQHITSKNKKSDLNKKNAIFFIEKKIMIFINPA